MVKGLGLVVFGLAIAGTGIYIGEMDDAPGASLMGVLVMIGMVTFGVRTALRNTAHP